MSNNEIKPEAPRVLDVNEIAAVSGGTDTKVREMANETYTNRVKTSDKHQKSVLEFVKG